jgi:hypothetical protein
MARHLPYPCRAPDDPTERALVFLNSPPTADLCHFVPTRANPDAFLPVTGHYIVSYFTTCLCSFASTLGGAPATL